LLFTLDDKEEEKKKGLRFDIISNILFLGGSKAMGKIKKRPINIRTVGDKINGKYSVSDEWPPRSFSGKYFLPSRTLTRVDKGEVYMNEYILGKAPTTTIHRAGNAFAQDPDTVYAVGSVYGAHTVSFSEAPIDPIFIPEERDDED
jgi:hypothetical protein